MARSLTLTIGAVLLALPWLVGASGGPTPSMLQWGATGCAVIGLLLMGASGAPTDLQFWANAAAAGLLMAATLNAGIVVWGLLGSSEALASWRMPIVGSGSYGPLRQRNQLASLMNLGLVCLAWHMRQPQRQNLTSMSFAIAVAILLGAVNGFSSSRTGTLQFVVILLMLGIWKWWACGGVRVVIVAALGAYAIVNASMLLAPGASGALARMMEAEPTGCLSRLVLWDNVFQLIAQRPWTGWGWGELDYAHYITEFTRQRFCAILDNAHNLPLHLAVELGVPVALLFCAAVAWATKLGKPWSELVPHRQLAWGLLALIGVHSMVEYPLWYGPFLLMALMASVMLCRTPEWPVHWTAGRQFARAGSAALAAALLAYMLVVGWNYHRVSQLYLPYEARDPAYRGDTLAKVRDAWLFRNQVNFAELTATPLNERNAARMYLLAQAVLHFSPEPRVIERLIESARMTAQEQEAKLYEARYATAFPQEFAQWNRRVHDSAAQARKP